MTCVDCSVTFYGDDYAAHTTCISEAEKYEKSLFKPKSNVKPKPQDLWNSLIEDIVSLKQKAPPAVQVYLPRLASLSNVPRNHKKFLNFSKNSLNIRDDRLLESIWKFLEECRVAKEKEGEVEEEPTSIPTPTPTANISKPSSTSADSAATVSDAEEEEVKVKKDKKNKKRKREEGEEEGVGVGELITADKGDEHSSEKKKKKEKKHKKDKVEKV